MKAHKLIMPALNRLNVEWRHFDSNHLLVYTATEAHGKQVELVLRKTGIHMVGLQFDYNLNVWVSTYYHD